MLKTKESLIIQLDSYINSGETDPEKLSKKILNTTAQEYTSKNKETFANELFFHNIMDFNNEFANSNNKITRNSILAIGHISVKYSFYTNRAFNFMWQYREDRKLIYSIARSIYRFPQFLETKGYTDFLLLPKTAPKKDSIDMLFIILSNIAKDINDKDILIDLVNTFELFIEKYPELYQSLNEYPKLVSEMNSHISQL